MAEFYEQPGSTLGKQPGLTVYTKVVRGPYEKLKDIAEKAMVGIEVPSALCSGGVILSGRTTAVQLRRDTGELGELVISAADKDEIETWQLDWVENQKDIRTWQGSSEGGVELPKLRTWEAMESTNPTAYTKYQWNAECSSDILEGDTLELAKMIAEKGIESYLSYAPQITKISTVKSWNGSSSVGKIDKPKASEKNVTGDLTVSDFTAMAKAWLKTTDRIQTALDGTLQRTEAWLGADEWNAKLYSNGE